MAENSKRRHGLSGLLCVLCSLLIAGGADAQKGHRIDGMQVVVEGANHWKNWTIPKNLAQIDSAGRIAPKNFRTVYNVLADTAFRRPTEIFSKTTRIATIDSTARVNASGELLLDTQGKPIFDYSVRPGISRVGSNPQLADRIFDGDPTTYWEPNPNDPISDWWIEIDLGRVIPLERLRLDFVDEMLGDPFLKFVLLLSERQTPGRFEEGELRFSRIVPFEAANTDQRVFVFDSEQLSEDLPASEVESESRRLTQNYTSPEWTGRRVETIRIVITDSRMGRAEEISEEAWQALPVRDRGDVTYFVRDLSGREEPIDAATYAQLEPDRQGKRVYYRRELPRLSEVEAWGWGDNLSLAMKQNGSAIEHTFANTTPIAAFDGDGSSNYKHAARDPEKPDDNILIVDLGGSVWINQIRYFATGMRGYLMRGSSGVRDAQGELVWQNISPQEREKNSDNGFYESIADILENPVQVRFLELTTFVNANVDNVGASIDNYWPTIYETQIFSKGPTAKVVVESDLIELPGNFNLGAIDWGADVPPGTKVEIRTRTGSQLYQIIRYFKNSGEEQTAEQYAKLPGFLKGQTDTTLALGPDWSPWSQQYISSGAKVTSPSLRRFLQIQASLISSDGQSAPALERMSVQLHDPVAQQLGAEIWPIQAEAGLMDTFEVFVQPGFLAAPISFRQPGLDEILLRSEPSWDMALVDVAVGTADQFENDAPAALFADAGAGNFVDEAGASLLVQRNGSDSLWVQFPSLIQRPTDSEQTYYRKLQPGDLVPVSTDGVMLTVTSHSLLPIEEQGPVLYFRRDGETLAEVRADAYDLLPAEERGPVRYMRVIAALGEESPYNDQGDVLTSVAYNRLPSSQRGSLVSRGDLIRLRFAARVFLDGSNVKAAVRNSAVGGVWQEAQAADVTTLTPSEGLEIRAMGRRDVLSQLSVAPNPFTPNGDNINDRTTLSFSLYKMYEERPVQVRVYRLDGSLVRTIEELMTGGAQQVVWDGRDESGNLVSPGLYLAQVEVATDSETVAGRQFVKLVGVAY